MPRDDDPPDEWAEELAMDCQFRSLQRFIRENFGLYYPPADYAELRRENLRRTLTASRFTARPPANTATRPTTARPASGRATSPRTA